MSGKEAAPVNMNMSGHEDKRTEAAPRAGTSALPFCLYLLAITAAELLTVYLQPVVGVVCHSLILVALFIQSVLVSEPRQSNLILALTLVPLVRIVSLSLPLGQLPQVFWYPLVYAPLLAATAIVMWTVRLRPAEIGLVRRGLPLQILIGVVTGLAFGITEYLILSPKPLVNSFTLEQVWFPAIILLTTTGLVEELMFRGVLQRLAEAVMGSWGLIYISLIFAVLHVGFYSLLDVAFVLGVALFFAAVVKRTGSLIGVILSHGIANSFLYLAGAFILS